MPKCLLQPVPPLAALARESTSIFPRLSDAGSRSTAAIGGTSSVDSFSNAPQIVFLAYFVAVTLSLSTMPPKSKGKTQKGKEPVSTEEVKPHASGAQGTTN